MKLKKYTEIILKENELIIKIHNLKELQYSKFKEIIEFFGYETSYQKRLN